MNEIVDFHEAKTHLSKLLDRVIEGEEIVIGKAGRPVARLIPVRRLARHRAPGSARGKVQITADFDEPLPDGLGLIP
jgi:prevent-host-death family protein